MGGGQAGCRNVAHIVRGDLQEGKEVGRIGYYTPDIDIKGNMIDSITGYGFLYPKRQ